MGKTYHGTRKKFAVVKTQKHKDRAKWKGQNGTRLRSLASDLADFKAAGGDAILHTPRPFTAFSPPPPIAVPEPAVQGSGGNSHVHLFTKYSLAELESHKDYAARQVSHLTKLLKCLRATDPSAPALRHYESQKKKWDRQTGILGSVLFEATQNPKWR